MKYLHAPGNIDFYGIIINVNYFFVNIKKAYLPFDRFIKVDLKMFVKRYLPFMVQIYSYPSYHLRNY